MQKESFCQNWDWSHAYRNVYSSNALDHIVEQTNIQKKSEGGNTTYWCPVNNNQEARITKKFTFPKKTNSAYLKIKYIYIANFSASQYGFGGASPSGTGQEI